MRVREARSEVALSNLLMARLSSPCRLTNDIIRGLTAKIEIIFQGETFMRQCSRLEAVCSTMVTYTNDSPVFIQYEVMWTRLWYINTWEVTVARTSIQAVTLSISVYTSHHDISDYLSSTHSVQRKWINFNRITDKMMFLIFKSLNTM